MLRLDRAAWARHRTVPVAIEGLSDACKATPDAFKAVT
jgi:hypothetical protein